MKNVWPNIHRIMPCRENVRICNIKPTGARAVSGKLGVLGFKGNYWVFNHNNSYHLWGFQSFARHNASCWKLELDPAWIVGNQDKWRCGQLYKTALRIFSIASSQQRCNQPRCQVLPCNFLYFIREKTRGEALRHLLIGYLSERQGSASNLPRSSIFGYKFYTLFPCFSPMYLERLLLVWVLKDSSIIQDASLET